jgi:hypothetical protein
MPDLQPTLELGVAIQVHLWRGDADKVDLRVPVRRALAYSAGIIDAGTVAEAQLTYDHRLHWDRGGGEGNLGLLIGPVFADRRQNSYFYGVATPYATPQRPAYQPGGGYGGWEAIGALSRRTGSWWFAGFVRYDNLGGAVFADSPLVLRRSEVAGGFGVAWVFAMSRERVEAAQ